MNTPCFEQVSDKEIVLKIRELAAAERRVTVDLLHFIGEMEKRRCYAEIGFSTTFDFLTKDLGYSESAAWRRISAARLLIAVPETAEKVKSGEVNLTNLAQAQSAIRSAEKQTGVKLNTQTKAEVVRRVEGASSREADRQLKSMFPEVSLKQEIVRAVNDSHVRAHVTLTNAQLEKLERLREVLSHQLVGASLADIIEAAVDELLLRKDPLKREVKPRASKSDSSVTESKENVVTDTKSNPTTTIDTAETQCATGAGVSKQDRRNSKALAPSMRNLVYRRDEGMCQHVDETTGEICESRHFLEIDHVVPRAFGGSNEPENLRVLCRSHNRLMAEQIFGRKTIRSISKSKAQN